MTALVGTHARHVSADLGRPGALHVYAQVAFNQDESCFACATQDGFVVFATDPLKLNEYRVLGGGVAGVEMLFRCNFMALLSGGDRPAFDRQQHLPVVIWDDSLARISAQLDFSAESRDAVLAVRLRRDRICVVLLDAIKVFTLTSTPQPLHVLPTGNNPNGLCCLCPSSRRSLLAYPSTTVAPSKAAGSVEIVDLANVDKHRRHVRAHDSPLQAMHMHQDGTLLATASRKGTLIRVFECASGELAYELRRGSNRAIIQCMAFAHHFPLLCCTSNHGTLHIFTLSERQPSSRSPSRPPRSPSASNGEWDARPRENHGDFKEKKNKKLVPKYFRATSSAIKIDVFKASGHSPKHSPSTTLSLNLAQQQVVCAFTEHDAHVVVVSRAGDYNKFSFNTSTGKYAREYCARLADVIHAQSA